METSPRLSQLASSELWPIGSSEGREHKDDDEETVPRSASRSFDRGNSTRENHALEETRRAAIISPKDRDEPAERET